LSSCTSNFKLTFVSSSFVSLSKSCLELENFPSRPEKGEVFAKKEIFSVGSSISILGSAVGLYGSEIVSPIDAF
jgi:hypothetical protein